MRPKHNEFEVKLKLLSSCLLGGLLGTTCHRHCILGDSALVFVLAVMFVEQLGVLLDIYLVGQLDVEKAMMLALELSRVRPLDLSDHSRSGFQLRKRKKMCSQHQLH